METIWIEEPKFADDNELLSSGSGFISNWEDDTDGVQEESNPHDSPEKEILWAANQGELQIVRKLLTQNENLVHVTDTDGYTPLHRACYSNFPDIVDVLLECGADLYSRTLDGWTALHCACNWGNINCVLQLLSCGVDINVQTNGGVTPLHLAANVKNDIIMEVLLSHPQIDTSLKNDSGETAYEIAVRNGPYRYLFELNEPCLNEIPLTIL